MVILFTEKSPGYHDAVFIKDISTAPSCSVHLTILDTIYIEPSLKVRLTCSCSRSLRLLSKGRPTTVNAAS